MSEEEKDCKAKTGEKVVHVTNVIGDLYPKEKITSIDDAGVDCTYNFEPPKNDSCILENEENSLEENFDIFDTVSNPLYAAWWNYVRKNKGEKKKRKMLEIYRNENYWVDDKCSEDEFEYGAA